MSGQDSSATTIGEYDDTNGGVATTYRDDSLDDDPGVAGTTTLSSKSRVSTWTGSPYEPLPSEQRHEFSYSSSSFGDYDTGLAISRPTTYAPSVPADAADDELPSSGAPDEVARDRRADQRRARAGAWSPAACTCWASSVSGSTTR